MFSGNKKQRALKEIESRRNRRETYLEPLPGNAADMKEFLMYFYRDVLFHRTMISEECSLYPNTVKVHYNEVVLQQKLISYEDFWQRYFYRTSSVDRVMQELEQKDAELKLQRASSSFANPSLLPSWMMYASSSTSTRSPPRATMNPSTPPREETPAVTPAGASTSKVERNPVDLIPQRVLATTSSSPMDVRTESSSGASGTNVRKTNFLDLLPKRNSSAVSDSGTFDESPIILTKKPMPDPETISTQPPPLVLKLDEQAAPDPMLLVDFPKRKDDTLVASSALELANASSTSLAKKEDEEEHAVIENEEDFVEVTKAYISSETMSQGLESNTSFSNPEVLPSASETVQPGLSLPQDETKEDISSIPTPDAAIHNVEADTSKDDLETQGTTDFPHEELAELKNVAAAAQNDTLVPPDAAPELLSDAPVTQFDHDEGDSTFRSVPRTAEANAPSIGNDTIDANDAIVIPISSTPEDLALDHPSVTNAISKVLELDPLPLEKEKAVQSSNAASMVQNEPFMELLADVPESDRAYLSNFLSSEEKDWTKQASDVELPPPLFSEPATDPLDVVKSSIVEADLLNLDAQFVTPPGQVSFEAQRTAASELIDAAFSVVNPFDAVLTPSSAETSTALPSFESVDSPAFLSDSFQSWEGPSTSQNPFSASISASSKPSTTLTKEIQHAFDPFFAEVSSEHGIAGPAENASTFATSTRASVDDVVTSSNKPGVSSSETSESEPSSKTTNFLGFTNPFKSTLVDVVQSKNAPALAKVEVLEQNADIPKSSDESVVTSALGFPEEMKMVPEDAQQSVPGFSFRNLFNPGAPESLQPVVDKNDRIEKTRQISEAMDQMTNVKVKHDVDNVFSKPTDEFEKFSVLASEKTHENEKQQSLSVAESQAVELPMQAPTLGERFIKLFPSKKRKQALEPSDSVSEVEKGPPVSKLARFVGFPDLSEVSSKKSDEKLSANVITSSEFSDTKAVLEEEPFDFSQNPDKPSQQTTDKPSIGRGLGPFFRSISGKDDIAVPNSSDAKKKEQASDVASIKSVVQPTVLRAVDSDSRAPTPVTSNVDLAAMDRPGIVETRGGIRIATVSNIFLCILVASLGICVAWIGQHSKGIESALDGICGPVPPGWSSPKSPQIVEVQAEAPFWIHAAEWKPFVFRTVCGTKRPRTILKWTRQKSGQHDFEILDADSDKLVSVMKKKNLRAASVKTDHIEIVNARGKIVQFPTVWTRQHNDDK